MTDAQLLQSVIDNILTGGRRTKAAMTRTVLNAIINDKQNKDGKNVANGYAGLDANTRILLAQLAQASQTGLFLRDDGTFAIPNIKPLFNSFGNAGNVGTSETDLVSNSIAADTFVSDGEKIEAMYSGSLRAHATATRQIRLYFAGTQIFDSAAFTTTSAEAYLLRVSIIAFGGSTVRYTVEFRHAATDLAIVMDELGGLNFANANILKITGTAAAAGAASGDIINKMSKVDFLKSA